MRGFRHSLPLKHRKTDLLQEVLNWIFIVLGSALLAFGVVGFLAPNHIATGGTPGMSILLNALTGLSLGALVILINAPLLFLGLKTVGKAFTLRTVVTTLLLSALIDLFSLTLELPAMSDDPILACLFGGVCVGLGVGLILKGKGSAGGSTILARIFLQRFGIRPGKTIMMADMVIIVSSAFVFKNIETALLSLISIYATSRCIDAVVTGNASAQIIHIVTDQVALMSAAIQQRIGPHGTVITGKSISDQKSKNMIFVVIENRRITQLKELVRESDPHAFVVTMEAKELMGRGY